MRVVRGGQVLLEAENRRDVRVSGPRFSSRGDDAPDPPPFRVGFSAARRHVARARVLVDETGYGRREREVAWLEGVLGTR